MQPIRLAHLHSSTGIYGAERWTATQIKHLSKDLVTPIVITLGTRAGSTLFHEWLGAQGYDTVHIPIPGKFNLKVVTELRQVLRERHIQILHTHGFKSDVMGFFASRGLPVALVSTPHGWSAAEGLRIRLYEALSRRFLRYFDRIYPLSPALLADLRRRGYPDRKLRLILNAVDTDAFEACYRDRRVRPPGESFNVLFIGRLCRPKGVFELIEAFSRAVTHCKMELRLVGSGPEFQALQARCVELGVEPNVRFIGAVEDVSPHLLWSSALILPSHSEGIPRVLMEAFSAGVPVIGTAIPGIQQLVSDGATGLLVRPGDVQGLAHALVRLACAPDAAQRMAEEAHEVVHSRFSAKRQALEFEHEYRHLVSFRAKPMPAIPG
jgi:glycosyltransferase involved in cell wall biosynthesis